MSFHPDVATAVEREHKRFASDLHDGVCQELAGIAWMLDSLTVRVAADVATEIRSIADHIRRVSVDARRLALGLAPIAVERAGLTGALGLLKIDVEALWGGRAVEVSIEERSARDLPLNIAVNLYRIAQEATANAVRHSGASHIHISTEACDEGLSLTVEDDGCGIGHRHHESSGLGIKSMISRAQMLGGELAISPSSPRGTKVQVIVPMQIGKVTSANLSR